MRANIVSTSKIVTLIPSQIQDGQPGMPARIWEGVTEKGVKFHAYIVRVAADEMQDLRQFDEELRETRVPSAEVDSIPLRLIL